MKKRTKIILAMIGVVLAIPVFLIAVYIIGSMPGSTKKLEAVGAQFKPDPEWEFKGKTVRPPRTICLEGTCGIVYYSWTANNSFSKEKLEHTLEQSNLDFDINGSCDPTKGISGSGSTICDAQGDRDDVHIRINAVASVDAPEIVRVDVEVKK